MPKIEYEAHRFQTKSLILYEYINAIIDKYQAAGYQLTIRQLYYQLVSKNLIENNDKNYKRIGNILENGRLAGLIDWNAIEDRGRSLNYISSWESPADIIKDAADRYHRDLWEGQKNYLEIWVEKQALESVIERAASSFGVQSFACKGYPSITALWEAAEYRLLPAIRQGRKPIIIYLGDHDPSGVNINETILSRLELFTSYWVYEPDIKLERIALTHEQIRQYNPPPNPAKETDTRAAGYIKNYGSQSWELDALPPEILDQLITDAIKS